MVKKTKILNNEAILWSVLRNARPHKSQAIQETMHHLEMLARHHNPGCRVRRDKVDNLWIDTRTEAASGTMFMAHLDTVERKPGTKEIWLNDGKVHTGGKNVLGADDGAGIAILAALMEHGIPALYLFSQNEESGGTGGAYAAQDPALNDGTVQRCIAFDRKGTNEVCGEQCVGALASVDFVVALSDALGLGHQWGQGTYTDNSEFKDIVPEIVNVSVGYEANHGPKETLDWIYWQSLRDAVLEVNWELLPTIGPAEDLLAYGYGVDQWPGSMYGMGDADDAVREALWDLCDEFGLATNDADARSIRLILENLVDRVAYRAVR